MICLLGGTFDPVHLGHIHAAIAVCRALALDEIHLVLSARPSHKNTTGASLEDRWEMLRLACSDDARLIPTATPGSFFLSSHMKVKKGHSGFNCGEMVIDGQSSTLNFDAQGVGSAEYQGFGRLCRCRPSDN